MSQPFTDTDQSFSQALSAGEVDTGELEFNLLFREQAARYREADGTYRFQAPDGSTFGAQLSTATPPRLKSETLRKSFASGGVQAGRLAHISFTNPPALLGVAQSLKNQRQLAELLLVFEGVSDCPRASLPWQRVVLDRLSDRYRPCFRLAELFLKDRPPDVSGGRAHGFSLFFDMNMLFEEYIGRMARRAIQPRGFQVTLQSPRRHLALSKELGTQVFAMLPDVVGIAASGVEWILDTKWKQLSTEKSKDGVAQDDMYQMYAYAQRYKCPNVVLLYPHHRDLGEAAGVRSTYLLAPWLGGAGRDDDRRVRVATIDLANLKTVGTQLDAIRLTDCGACTWKAMAERLQSSELR